MISQRNPIRPIVWTIAGSDSSGGAGIQADLHTFNDFHVHGCSVITALTAQNSLSVTHIEWTSKESLTAQLNALLTDFFPVAIKLGMLGDDSLLPIMSQFLQEYSGWVVCDPVLSSSTGKDLLDIKHLDYYIQKILPFIGILTPNLLEAERLVKHRVVTSDEIISAAKTLLEYGVKHVLIKGGHSTHSYCQDYYQDQQQGFWLSSLRQTQMHTHGSGCTLASALTGAIAQGFDMKNAMVIAKMYINKSIRYGYAAGQGIGPVAHVGLPDDPRDVPWLTEDLNTETLSNFQPFPDCGSKPLGLYAIVDSIEWISRLINLGVDTIQLRIKSDHEDSLYHQIRTSIQIAKEANIRLFINDHWQLALNLGAYGVHLGQEDMETADFKKLSKAKIRVGISVHNYEELARAHKIAPSYIGFGPVFPTKNKHTKISMQGLDRLRHFVQLSPYPVVAIGGIKVSNAAQVVNCGVNGIAMIEGITAAVDLSGNIQKLLGLFTFASNIGGHEALPTNMLCSPRIS